MKFNPNKKNGSAQMHEQGVWVSLDDDIFEGRLVLDDPRDGPAIRVASKESRLFQRGYTRVQDKNADVIRATNRVPPEIMRAMVIEGLMGAIVDWRLLDDEGKPIAFNLEKLRWYLTHEPSIRDRATTVANDLAKYDAAAEAADTQNLSTTSSGRFNGPATSETESAGETSFS